MNYIYITNKPYRAKVADTAGVNYVMVDLEILGKIERQGRLNTVISRHSLDDVNIIKRELNKSKLLVRVNPIHDGSYQEINSAIDRGADAIMLPMFRSVCEVEKFINYVANRAETVLLVETAAAFARLDQIVSIEGVDFVHFGLNDLHLEFKLDFMFEIVSGGLMDYASEVCLKRKVAFGFGGVSRLDCGLVSANLILAEHFRVHSNCVILSRDFNSIFEREFENHEAEFKSEFMRINNYFKDLSSRPIHVIDQMHMSFIDSVRQVVDEIQKVRTKFHKTV